MPAITRHERRKEGREEGRLQIKEIIVVVVGEKGLKVSWMEGQSVTPVCRRVANQDLAQALE